MKNADMPAMPVTEEEYSPDRDEYALVQRGGLTKREYFAALALQGILSNSKTSGFTPAKGCHYAFLSELAVNYAEALLAELERTS